MKSKLILESDIIENGRDTPVRDMMPKQGSNYHIHVIVSRRDKQQKYKLSPLAESRGSNNHIVGGKKVRIGFDRNAYYQKCENIFDNYFVYVRDYTETYRYFVEQKKELKNTIEIKPDITTKVIKDFKWDNISDVVKAISDKYSDVTSNTGDSADPLRMLDISQLKSTNYNDIIQVLNLIGRESDIIYKIPSIPPTITYSYKIPITSKFGERLHPITNFNHNHNGIDLAMNYGDTISVTADGIITNVGYNNKLGNYIYVQHICNFKTIYGHLSKILVSVGDVVVIGESIGLCGSTGGSTGAHLHYSIKENNVYQNPLEYCYLLFNQQKNNLKIL